VDSSVSGAFCSFGSAGTVVGSLSFGNAYAGASVAREKKTADVIILSPETEDD
jgi:ApbE superfamily uncharacterized protein (UPF0280 family)